MDLSWIPEAIDSLNRLMDSTYQKNHYVWIFWMGVVPFVFLFLLVYYVIKTMPARVDEIAINRDLKRRIKNRRRGNA